MLGGVTVTPKGRTSTIPRLDDMRGLHKRFSVEHAGRGVRVMRFLVAAYSTAVSRVVEAGSSCTPGTHPEGSTTSGESLSVVKGHLHRPPLIQRGTLSSYVP